MAAGKLLLNVLNNGGYDILHIAFLNESDLLDSSFKQELLRANSQEKMLGVPYNKLPIDIQNALPPDLAERAQK